MISSAEQSQTPLPALLQLPHVRPRGGTAPHRSYLVQRGTGGAALPPRLPSQAPGSVGLRGALAQPESVRDHGVPQKSLFGFLGFPGSGWSQTQCPTNCPQLPFLTHRPQLPCHSQGDKAQGMRCHHALPPTPPAPKWPFASHGAPRAPSWGFAWCGRICMVGRAGRRRSAEGARVPQPAFA